MHCGGPGRGNKLLTGKKRKKKSLPILPNIYSSVSDHYFAALVIIRALMLLIGISLGKQVAQSNEKFIL